jgi:DNA-binding MarR family transcriptional regulator
MAEQTAVDEVPAGGAPGSAARDLCARAALDERITFMGLLVEAHARLTRVLGHELEAECGLPLTWFDVMVRIGRTPEGFLTMSGLANEVSLTSGGITRLVDRIAAAGYVERRNCPTDRRSIFVSLTPTGVEMLERASRAHLEGLERHLLGPLEPAERAALEAGLRKLRDHTPDCSA